MNRPTHWRRVGDVLRDHIVCPQCGENAPERKPPHCNTGALECDCSEPGRCFVDEGKGLVWRRSPCASARCNTCGWVGVLRSREYEQRYGASRCPISSDGVHDAAALVYRNEQPGALTIRLRCKLCGALGHITVDPVDGLAWEFGGSDEVQNAR